MNIGKVALLLCFFYAAAISQLTDTEISEVYKDADKWKALVNKATFRKQQQFQYENEAVSLLYANWNKATKQNF